MYIIDIFLFYRKGRLWDFIKSHYKINKGVDTFKRKHTRSFSCDAIIQSNLEKTCENQNKSLDIKEKQNGEKLKTGIKEFEAKNDITNISINFEQLNKTQISVDSNHDDIHTTQLLVNAQKLLQSVSATLKKSNSIATRLNESQQLLYSTENVITNLKFSTSEKLVEESEPSSCELEDSKNKPLSDSKLLTEKILEPKQSLYSAINKSSDLETYQFYLSTMTEGENMKNECIAQFCENIQEEVQFNFSEKLESNAGYENFNDDKVLWKISEDVLQLWSAQILVALESLHQQDTVVADLRPENILINDEGNIIMSYMPPRRNFNLLKFKEPYSSPELCAFAPPLLPTTAVDIWSFGVLLYELFTGLVRSFLLIMILIFC